MLEFAIALYENWTPCRCRSICAITSTMRPTDGTFALERKAASFTDLGLCAGYDGPGMTVPTKAPTSFFPDRSGR